MEYVLTTNNLTKTYKGVKAVDNVNMNIAKGSIYGFVGKNGAGKTTFIRIITGLVNQTSGEYSLFGTNKKSEILKQRRRIGAIVETPSIYLNMTAYENLKLHCMLLGTNKAAINDVLETVNLTDTGKKKAKNFSLGMKQRLCIAIALLSDPDFLVLDEPTNGLDPEGIIEIRELLLKLNKEKDITILISSHILSELSRLATHYGIIEKGVLIKQISALELNQLCRKCVVVSVDDVNKVPPILLKAGIKDEFRIVSKTDIEIYEKFDINDLILEFKNSGIKLLKITERDEDLESFYINTVGGKIND